MSTSKHTPAPWKVLISGMSTPDHKIQPAYVLNYVGRTIPAISEDETAANGRLIEAAPRMFEIIQRVWKHAETDGSLPVLLLQDIEDVIKKVEVA